MRLFDTDQFPDEGTFDADMNYRPPGFEDATTIDYDNLP